MTSIEFISRSEALNRPQSKGSEALIYICNSNGTLYRSKLEIYMRSGDQQNEKLDQSYGIWNMSVSHVMAFIKGHGIPYVI